MNSQRVCPFYGQSMDRCDIGSGYISPYHVEMIVRSFLEKEHHAQEERWKKGLESKFEYKPRDWVWALRVPRPNNDTLDTWWVGPGRIVARVGGHSYKVEIKERSNDGYDRIAFFQLIFHDLHGTSSKNRVEWSNLRGSL